MKHELKILPSFFDAVVSGDKTFEIRDNNERGFQRGDTVVLREYDRSISSIESFRYTGREHVVRITYVTGFEQKPGFVVFGFTAELGDDSEDETHD